MSTESYLESARPYLAERKEKVRTVVTMLQRIVRNHAIFDYSSMGHPMRTLSAPWSQDKPNEHVWFYLRGQDGKQIDRSQITDMENREHAVGSADFISYDEHSDSTIMTIEVYPPNVKGYDSSPLTSSQLEGAITDLTRYEAALISGRIEQQ